MCGSLVLHEGLDLTPSTNQSSDKTRQHTLVHIIGRWFWNLPLSLKKGKHGSGWVLEEFRTARSSSSSIEDTVVKSMFHSWMMLGYNELKSMTSTYRSHNPLLGSKTRPPLYLSRLAFPPPLLFPPPPPPSPSSSRSSFILGVVFLPHVLSGQMYFNRWNSCSRMYSFRSARPPFKVLFLETPGIRELDG